MSFDWLRATWLDARFALRTFAARPAYTAVAALTLAAGIGAATAVFSIVDAVLLRPLPYRDPSRIAAIWITSTRENALAKLFATYEDYDEFRRNSRSFDSMGAATWAKAGDSVMTGQGPARSVLVIPATASFFETLGVSAALGRAFRRDDEARGCSLLLAYRFWSATLAADPAIVGKSLAIDEKPCTVLGVMPAEFSFYPTQTQVWTLLGPGFQPNQKDMLVGIFGRLKPGVSMPQAQAELRGFYRAIHPTGEMRDFEPVVFDLHGEFTFLAGRTLRTTLLLVFAAVMLVLLIACLNVANLLLARLSERRRELAVRAALGSGQSRLVRQLLTESLLLALFGAVPGGAFAFAAVRYFRHANPIELSVGANVAINRPVLFFAIALSLATTLAFGLLPAVRASRVDLTQYLKAAGRGMISGRQRLAKAVIAVEMALSFLLLTGAGLFLASALRMGSERLGFNPERISAARVSLPPSRYPNNSRRLLFYDQILESLDRAPGVSGVVISSKIPPEAGGNQTLEAQGRPPGAAQMHDVGGDAVSPAFFDVLGIPLRRGRVFDARDRQNSAPVAIVNEALANEYFPRQDPLGRQIRIPGGDMPWLTIVGVVGNLKHTQLMNEMSWVESPILYRPFPQEPRRSFQIAARIESVSGEREIRSRIGAIDPALPMGDLEPLVARLSRTLAYPRFRAIVLAFFAFASLILSAVGLHGVVSQLVAQRIPEFGVRRAVGAQTHDLLWLMAREGGAPVLLGLAAGLALTLALRRVIANLLYGIHPADPQALALVSLALILAAALAILRPATRAARVDPMEALRHE